MATIFSALVDDNSYVLNSDPNQGVFYDLAMQYVNRMNEELASQLEVFVSGATEKYSETYKLPAGGYMQRRDAQGRVGSVKASGSWSTAYPLYDFGDAIFGNDVDLAYMTAMDFQNHIDGVLARNANTTRYEILSALSNNSNVTVVDKLHGTLAIKPLANGDSDLYPPVLGATSEATDNHYLASGYASAAISNANNPFKPIVNEIEEHFGETVGGSNIAVFISEDETEVVEGLADFREIPDNFIISGVDQDIPTRLPKVPGRIIGRMVGASACWVVQWRNMPSGYMFGIHLEEEAPLKMRVDPTQVGLGIGLQLVAVNEEYPFLGSYWRNRFGLGVANRLNGVWMQLIDGSYSAPTVA